MPSPIESNLKSILSSIFARKGAASPSCKLWDDWNEDGRGNFGGMVLQTELPVLLSLFVSEQPILLTTQRLVAGRRAVDLIDIIDVKPADFSTKGKSELNELEIIIRKGPNITISIESGPPYFGFWNVLLHIAKANFRKAKAS